MKHFEAEGEGSFVQCIGNLELASMYSSFSIALQSCISPEKRDVSLRSVSKSSITVQNHLTYSREDKAHCNLARL